MDFGIGADINDAFATRIPLAAPLGGPTVQPEPDDGRGMTGPVVVLPPMTHAPSRHAHPTPAGAVAAAPDGAVHALPAAATHGGYVPAPAPYVDARHAYVQPPTYIERLSGRRKDVMRLAVLSLMVTLGIAVHSTVFHYVRQWVDFGGLTARQEFLARALYPAGVLFALWNVKALQ